MGIPFLPKHRRGSYKTVGNLYLFDRLPSGFLPAGDSPPQTRGVGEELVRVYASEQVVSDQASAGLGMCVRGTVLTALHVIEDAPFIRIEYGGKVVAASEIARDEQKDLVLIKPAHPLGAADAILSAEEGLGDSELFCFGYLSLLEKRCGRITTYKEQLCSYRIPADAPRRVKAHVFAAEVPSWTRDFFLGFSGSVLVDDEGAVRGMITVTIRQFRWWGQAHIGGINSRALREFIDTHISDQA